MEACMMHDAPLLMVTVLLPAQPSPGTHPRYVRILFHQTNGHNRDSTLSRPAAPLGVETSHEITSRDLAYSIAPFRRPIYAVF